MPVKILSTGIDIDIPYAWVAISLLGSSAALLLGNFLKELGTQAGKAAFKRLEQRARERRARETAAPTGVRVTYDRKWDHPHDVILVYQIDKTKKLIVIAPESETPDFDSIMTALPEAVDGFLSEASINLVELNVILAWHEDEWRFQIINTVHHTGINFEFYLGGRRII